MFENDEEYGNELSDHWNTQSPEKLHSKHFVNTKVRKGSVAAASHLSFSPKKQPKKINEAGEIAAKRAQRKEGDEWNSSQRDLLPVFDYQNLQTPPRQQKNLDDKDIHQA